MHECNELPRKKVLIFTNVPRSRDRVAGGVQSVAFNFLKAVSQNRDFEISVVDCFGDDKEDIYFIENNITYYYVASPRPKLLSRVVREIPKILSIIKKIDPDIIHAHTTSTAYIALQSGIPTILTPHMSILESIANSKGIYKKFNSIIYAYLEYRVMKKIKHIIQISPYIYNAFRKRTSAIFYPIYNPINEKFFCESAENSDYVLFVGKLDENKSPLHILMAFNKISREFKNIKIKLVGPYTDSKYVETMKLFCDHNQMDMVEFTGIKTGDELLILYRNCSFLILPSKQETAPMAIAEAMACGKPVIASNISGNPWLVSENETGFLYEYGNIDQLADKMKILLSDKTLRKKFGQKAHEEACQKFHPDEVVRKTLALYNKVMASVD